MKLSRRLFLLAACTGILAGCQAGRRPVIVTNVPAGVDSSSAPVGSGQASAGPVDSTSSPVGATPATDTVTIETTRLTLPANLAYAELALAASGGSEPYTWRATDPAGVPAGLELTAEGVLRGVAGDPGAYDLAVEVQDGGGLTRRGSVLVEVQTPVLTVVAGVGVPGDGGDGGLATAALLDAPMGVALDGAGNLYVADGLNNRIRRVDARTGTISTCAGTGAEGFSGDGGPATAAALSFPRAVEVHPLSGDLYLLDQGNRRVRRIDRASGRIETVLGDGTTNTPVAGARALQCGLGGVPVQISFGPQGALYFTASERIWRVDPATQRVEVLTGPVGGRGPSDVLALDSRVATIQGLDVDVRGDVYVSEWVQVRKIEGATGFLREVVASDGATLGTSAGDGGPALSATCDRAYGVAVDPAGDVFVCDAARLRRVDAARGLIETVAGGATAGLGGAGLPAVQAQLGDRCYLALDGRGNVYLADLTVDRVVRVGVAE